MSESFAIAIPESKLLGCAKCDKPTQHVFVEDKVVPHYFKDFHGQQANGSGLKSIWCCHACGTFRIYGAPKTENDPSNL